MPILDNHLLAKMPVQHIILTSLNSQLRRQLSLQDKLNIIKEIDDGLKQVDAAKKYGLSQSKTANFLKKRNKLKRLLKIKVAKMSGVNVEEYLTADDLVVFAGVSEEEILSKITDEMDNDDEEDDDIEMHRNLY
ncbi:hypothetical protein AVEN_108154-1 [Araneus ventricosus]|uniref:HTH psq-type domain-containing protein n=1 Tax=Araneus ventricosus TaxID=182803 RepID=A0A4Y2RWE0_ARAVE|nr:hypothetical protein AVEN_108154-1 [Araneus ventricosus]